MVLLSPGCWYYRPARVGVKVAITVLCFNALTNTEHPIEGAQCPQGTLADTAVMNGALLSRDWSQGTCDPKLQLQGELDQTPSEAEV